MSIANNFDRSPDAGFTRSFDAESARRQFQLSLVLVLILAVATLMLGVMIRFDTPISASISPIKPIETHYAGEKPVRG
ncbi:MAG: hypothetical protein QOG66_2709 [Methylobacteriaceae bacterium]|jgi:hypothetical protein|nr:hypothetical protein [Methylobacteriaceae bacterium]